MKNMFTLKIYAAMTAEQRLDLSYINETYFCADWFIFMLFLVIHKKNCVKAIQETAALNRVAVEFNKLFN